MLGQFLVFSFRFESASEAIGCCVTSIYSRNFPVDP